MELKEAIDYLARATASAIPSNPTVAAIGSVLAELERLRQLFFKARADLWCVTKVTDYWQEDFNNINAAMAFHVAETAKLLGAADAAGGEL